MGHFRAPAKSWAGADGPLIQKKRGSAREFHLIPCFAFFSSFKNRPSWAAPAAARYLTIEIYYNTF